MTLREAGPMFEGYDATLQHIALLRRKRDQLQVALTAAEEQHVQRIGAMFTAGRIDMDQLWHAYEDYRVAAGTGFTKRWNSAVSVVASQIKWWPLRRPNGSYGSWEGGYPVGAEPAPGPGTCVVYVLFDPANNPCYVGSSQDLRARLSAHEKDGKLFRYWRAFPCADRAAAFDLETRLLRQFKPYLNKKAAA